jgi:hypothetical protein
MKHPYRIWTAVAGTLTLIAALVFIVPDRSAPDAAPTIKAQKGGLEARVERKKDRSNYFNMIYRDPATGRIPAGIKNRELAFARTLPTTDLFTAKGAALSMTWTEAGPDDVSGRTRAIAIDVTNSNTVLAGGTTGGIWRSTDSGANWTLVSEPHLAVTRIAQDPRTGQTSTWYAATGESLGSFNNGTDTGETLHGTGMYKSTDGGSTWTQIQASVNPASANDRYDYIGELVVSPTTGSVFAVLNKDGIFRSTDGGATFTSVLGEEGNHPPHGDVAVDPNGNLLAVLYNTTTFTASGVYYSTDDGATWSDVIPQGQVGFPAPFENYYERTVIGWSQSNPDVAYLLTYMGQKKDVTGGQVDDARLTKLTISTATYEDRSDNIPAFLTDATEVNVGGYDSQGNYNMTIAVHPTDENHVIIGGTNLFRSRDGFATSPSDKEDAWIGGYATANDISQYANNHPDHHALVFDPNNPNRLYNGHDGGISVVNDITTQGAVNWTWLNNKYNVTQLYHVSIPRAADDPRIGAGTQDNGSPFFTFDGTTTSASSDITTGDGAYQYVGANVVMASSQNGRVNMYQNQNGTRTYFGEATACSSCGQLFVHPYTVDPATETRMFYPAGQDMYRGEIPDFTNSFEMSWTKMDNLSLPAGYGVSALAVSTSPAGVLYWSGFSASGAPIINRLEDALTATDGEVDRSIPGVDAGAYILNLAINPSDANEVIASIANYNVVSLYHTTDGGQNWSAIEGNLAGSGNDGPSVRATTILPFGGETIYLAATSAGLYSTQTLSGASTQWTREGGDALGTVAIAWVDSRPSDGRVAVGTHGRGVFVGVPSAGSSNTAPVASDVTGAGLEDATTNVTLSATDGDNDALTYSIVSQPSNGSAQLSGSSVTYTPSADFNGSDSFTYKVNDGTTDSNTATASVTVSAVNDAPSFSKGADQSVAANSGPHSVANWATDISAGPANESSQTITFAASASNTALFTAGPAITSDGTLTYTLATDASGTSSVDVTASDDGGTANGGVSASAAQSFTITVTQAGSNTAPVAADVSGMSLEDGSGNVTLSGTDSDNDTLTFTVATQPSNGTIEQSGASITYTPAADFFGTDTFTYVANDGTVDSAPATATITVAAVNDAPSFTVGGDQSVNIDSGEHTVENWASDISAGPDNESSQTVSFTLTPSNASLFAAGPEVSATGTLSYTLAAGASGETTVDIYVVDDGGTDNDGVNASESQSFNISVADNTSIDDAALPTEFALNGAYPNPFNPTTNLSMDLPVAAQVRVDVYDLSGRIVLSVPSRAMSAGSNQTIRINATELGSGSYLYRILASTASSTELMSGSFVVIK